MNAYKLSLNIPREDFIEKIKHRIELANNYLKTVVKKQEELEQYINAYSNWNTYNSEYLDNVFGSIENDYKSKYDAAQPNLLVFLPTIGGRLGETKARFKEKIKILDGFLYIADLIPDYNPNSKPLTPQMNNSLPDTTKVFIVHGQNNTIKIEVARTIETLGLKAIILHEQASGGKTIIEKLEHYSNVQFAVVLLTGDDEGRRKDTKWSGTSGLQDRARQNVILELGYFIAKLGRGKVMPLHEEGVEIPNDISGVVYVPLDQNGAWRYKLAQELRHAGYSVDSNLIN